jgi:hypothetical protein
MSTHVTISPTEAADRLAIRELVEAYAHCADRRDAKSAFQNSLTTLLYQDAPLGTVGHVSSPHR